MIELTMLTEMMGPVLEDSIHELRELGITRLDLKGGVFGKSIEDLDEREVERLACLLANTGVTAYCFSSVLGHWNVSATLEAEFRGKLMDGAKRLARTACSVRPELIRLLGCTFDGRDRFSDANEYLVKETPWVYDAYREAVDLLAGNDLTVTIENEPGSIFGDPAETVAFFDRLDRPGKVFFTWDIQNMWESGTYPTLEVYGTLLPIINYVHLKGGKGTPENPAVMKYRSLLEDAGWPVREIVGRVIDDRTSPVLCLNCSHGAPAGDYPLSEIWGTPKVAAEEAKRDVTFLRENFTGIR